MPIVPSTAALVHVRAPAVGSVEVRTLPLVSAATHNEGEGQESDVSELESITPAAFHENDPPVAVDANAGAVMRNPRSSHALTHNKPTIRRVWNHTL
jgi:hypothetical protein